MFRQSVRRAMKGVTSKLKLAKSQREWQAVSCQICLVVQQLAEALHRLRTVCYVTQKNRDRCAKHSLHLFARLSSRPNKVPLESHHKADVATPLFDDLLNNKQQYQTLAVSHLLLASGVECIKQ